MTLPVVAVAMPRTASLFDALSVSFSTLQAATDSATIKNDTRDGRVFYSVLYTTPMKRAKFRLSISRKSCARHDHAPKTEPRGGVGGEGITGETGHMPANSPKNVETMDTLLHLR